MHAGIKVNPRLQEGRKSIQFNSDSACSHNDNISMQENNFTK